MGRRRYQARRVKAFPFNYNRSKSANHLQWHWRRRDGGFIDGQPRLVRRPALKPPLKFAELFISIRLSNLLADCYLSALRLRKGLKSQSLPLLSPSFPLYFFALPPPLSMLFVLFLPLPSLPSRHLVKRVSLLHPLHAYSYFCWQPTQMFDLFDAPDVFKPFASHRSCGFEYFFIYRCLHQLEISCPFVPPPSAFLSFSLR